MMMHIPLENFEVVFGNVHIHFEHFKTDGFDGIEILFSDNTDVIKFPNSRKIMVRETPKETPDVNARLFNRHP